MKAYGCTEASDQAIPLTDVALALTPDAMQEFARFVAHAASEMERLGADYDHLHFKDFSGAWQEHWADIQLSKSYD
ncbi:MAG: hypothetical protein HOQ32_07920 [Lysobacter sp.]|nr:hypothetical protein [Lysobacter sp.]